MVDFAEKRLAQDTKSVSFWDPQPRMKIHTFADMWKTASYRQAEEADVQH